MKKILGLMRGVAKRLTKNDITMAEFYKETGITSRPIYRRFGTWQNAMKKAGLKRNKKGIKYTDDECYENLLNVWTHYGRQPYYREMKLPPSEVGPKAYITRWRSWTKALQAFIEKANSDDDDVTNTPESEPASASQKQFLQSDSANTATQNATSRQPSWKLKYKVMQRDNSKCRICR